MDAQKYGRLLSEYLPTVIQTEKENERMLAVVAGLMRKGEDLTPEEETFLRLAGHLIQEFEQRFYKPTKATPHQILKELINANQLKQSDLLPIFKSKGIASEVINGKRAISKAQAKALAAFFHVSAELFI